jgi:signal transduction histidine kinase
MSRQVSHLTRLIDDLLDVSRVTTGRIHVMKEDVPLDRTVARAVEAVQPLLDARKQRLEVELRHLRIVGDEARLTQIFINLLENASKYTPEDGSIRVRMRCDGDHATVAIADTGIGIEPDVLRDIFELFIQADNALDRAHGGLGVGLALVRTLVELHGGTVTASSPGRGRGSTFTVALPIGGS